MDTVRTEAMRDSVGRLIGQLGNLTRQINVVDKLLAPYLEHECGLHDDSDWLEGDKIALLALNEMVRAFPPALHETVQHINGELARRRDLTGTHQQVPS